MRSTALVGGAAALPALAVAFGVGCGDTDVRHSGGSGGRSAHPTTTHTAPVTTSTHGASTSVGAKALAIREDTSAAHALATPTTTDLYAFAGHKGDRLLLWTLTGASLANGSGAAASIDTVVTLFAPDGHTQIAQDDNGWPETGTDSQLFVELPVDGTYTVAVNDCHGVFQAGCPNPSGAITDFRYQLTVTNLAGIETNAGTTQDGTPANAVELPFTASSISGVFQIGEAGGDFRHAGEVHVFSFTPPLSASSSANARPRMDVFVQPIGPLDGDGSTSNVIAWVTDSGGNTILSMASEADHENGDSANGPLDLSLPVTLGSKYYLFVHDGNTAGNVITDYYFFQYALNVYDEVAEAPGVHALATQAQPLSAISGNPKMFVVDGDLTPETASGGPDAGVLDGGSDAGTGTALAPDWYSVSVPSGSTTAAVLCDAERSGSGLLGLRASLFDATGTTELGGATEAPDVDLFVPSVPIPPGAQTVLLQVRASSQDPVVSGTFYRCHLLFQ